MEAGFPTSWNPLRENWLLISGWSGWDRNPTRGQWRKWQKLGRILRPHELSSSCCKLLRFTSIWIDPWRPITKTRVFLLFFLFCFLAPIEYWATDIYFLVRYIIRIERNYCWVEIYLDWGPHFVVVDNYYFTFNWDFFIFSTFLLIRKCPSYSEISNSPWFRLLFSLILIGGLLRFFKLQFLHEFA